MIKSYVLITGASEGLGRELARIFFRNGHSLVLVARNQARLEELAKALNPSDLSMIKILTADLSTPDAADQLKTTLDKLGLEIGVLVNNAGSGLHGFFYETDWKATEAMLNLNMVSLTRLTRLLLPGMIRRGRGKILNIASTAAFQPGPFMAAYFASKACVLSLTEALAEELAGTGVTVTAFCPGPIRTQFQTRSHTENIRENAFAMDAQDAARAAYRGLLRSKRLVVPGWVNKLLVFLVRLFPRRIVVRAARFFEEKC
ncbi:MAG TPA: SDR family oxidoreductase [Candidatus Omnitrophota bacterium]|nr:SDR family oxidoreductase [Candidatus Omnitrophota bacterium]